MRAGNLVKISPSPQVNGMQNGTNFTGINIRRQGPNNSGKNDKKAKMSMLGPGQQTPSGRTTGTKDIVEQLGVKSRTGFIP